MNYLDRFLSVVYIHRDKLQLIGVVCMFIASKLKETNALSLNTLVKYTDYSVTVGEVVVSVVKLLNYI